MSNLSEKFIRSLMRFVIGMAVLFGVMIVMMVAWILFWDRPSFVTTVCTIIIAYFIGYAIDKVFIKSDQHDASKN